MGKEALYLRWRSKSFDDVVGQTHVTRTLQNACRANRVAHAYLFSGPRGTGKTSVARILAKALNCLAEVDDRPCNRCDSCVAINEGRYLDLIEIDGASNRGIDEIRDLRERVNFRPNQPGGRKVYIIDEVHMLTREAFNALLKTLEEPPEYVVFVFATTEVWRVPATIRSRCQRFDFRPIRADLIEARLRQICEAESFGRDDAALGLIARQATGSMRDAISVLDQMVSIGNGMVTVDLLRDVLGAAPDDAAEELLGLVLNRELGPALELLGRLTVQGLDMQQFSRDVLELTRVLMLVRLGVRPEGVLSPDIMTRLAETARDLDLGTLRHMAGAIAQAAGQARFGHLPQLPLELAMVDIYEHLTGPALPAALAPVAEPVTDAAPTPAAARPSSPPRRSREAAASPREPGPTARVAESAARRPAAEPVTLERAQRLWQKVWAKVQRHDRTLEPLLRSTEPTALEGDKLTVTCLYPFHQAVLSRPDDARVLAAAVEEVLGQPLTVEAVLRTSEAVPAEETAQPGESRSEPNEHEDPLVELARKMGGNVSFLNPGDTNDKT